MRIETLGDAWRVLESHGLEGKYCFHCDQFAQARVLQKQDEIISDMYEALKAVLATAVCNDDLSISYAVDRTVLKQINEALAKAK